MSIEARVGRVTSLHKMRRAHDPYMSRTIFVRAYASQFGEGRAGVNQRTSTIQASHEHLTPGLDTLRLTNRPNDRHSPCRA